MAAIFVFGSNLAGRHGKGAALFAARERGASYGIGEGRTGGAYAIPTKDAELRTLPLSAIESSVKAFIDYAKQMGEFDFEVTAIGCGLAGYKPDQIAPFFRDAPNNCSLPDEFKHILTRP